jgi:hypothetical protein
MPLQALALLARWAPAMHPEEHCRAVASIVAHVAPPLSPLMLRCTRPPPPLPAARARAPLPGPLRPLPPLTFEPFELRGLLQLLGALPSLETLQHCAPAPRRAIHALLDYAAQHPLSPACPWPRLWPRPGPPGALERRRPGWRLTRRGARGGREPPDEALARVVEGGRAMSWS